MAFRNPTHSGNRDMETTYTMRQCRADTSADLGIRQPGSVHRPSAPGPLNYIAHLVCAALIKSDENSQNFQADLSVSARD
eukprot:5649668-Pyramimonas_sp.AAC.1